MKLSLPDFSRGRVLVLGDVMLDRYWTGTTARISPEAPVPVVSIDGLEDRPGGAANVALNVATLGTAVSLCGLVGADANAGILESTLAAAGVDCHLSVVQSKPTITKLRVLSRHQQLLRLDFEQRFDAHEAQLLQDDLARRLTGVSVLVLSDYAKGSLHDYPAMIALARARGIPVLIDPKGRDFSLYRGATLLTPNLSEFEAVVGPCADEASLIDKGHALMRELAMSALLITRSEQGMTLLRQDEEPLHLPTHAREVFDVTGAGDTVISVLAAALASGQDLATAVALSNVAAGVVVGKLGTYAISAEELAVAIAPVERAEDGVLNVEQLQVALRAARLRGERIVMTNGCFDILHAGHVSYLQQARAQGDRLIVAVNDDASITRLKGDGRPINHLARRMAVLAGLKSVDWVVPFSDDTPEALLHLFRPDILVKGGDYQVDGVVGADIVRAYGGEVKVLGLVPQLSTTAIVDKIRQPQ